MSALLKKNFDYIRLLVVTKSRKQLKALAATITPEQTKTIVEIVHNALHLQIPISKTDRVGLGKHRAFLETLVDRKKSLKSKSSSIKQKLSTVIFLLKAVLPGLKALLQ